MDHGEEESHGAPQGVKPQTRTTESVCAVKKCERRQQDFCIDIWLLIITSKMRSVLIALHQVEDICCRSLPGKAGRSWWWETDTNFSLGPMAAGGRAATGVLALMGGARRSQPACNHMGEPRAPSPQEHGC